MNPAPRLKREGLIFAILITASVIAILPVVGAGSTHNSEQGESVNEERVLAIIDDVRAKLGVGGARGNYYLYLSGGVARFRVGDVLPSIIGRGVDEVVFAYFDGRAWHPLPFRAYDEVFGHVHILYNGTFKAGTVIEVRLPREYPVSADIRKYVPEFARGSIAYALSVSGGRGGVKGIIYAFVGGAVRYQMGSLRMLNNLDYPGLASPFLTAEAPMIADLMRKAGYGDRDVHEMMRYIVSHPITSVEPLWEEPVPDGGGGGGGYDYNLVEARGFPTEDMIQSSILLDSEGDTYSFRYYVIDPYLTSVKWYTVTLGIVAVPDQARDGAGSLEVTAENPDCGVSASGDFTLYSDRANIIKLPITASAYGTTCPYLDVQIKLVNPGATRWWVSARSVAYLKWEVSNTTLYSGHTRYYIQAFSGQESASGTEPQASRIMFTISPSKKADTKVFNLPLPSTVATPEPLKVERLKLLVSPPEGIDLGTEGPIKVTISIDGLSTCTATFEEGSTPKECDLLVSRYSMAEHIVPVSAGELSVTVRALGDISDTKAVTLWVSMIEPLTLPSRIMSQSEVGGGSIVDTSTYSVQSSAYAKTTYYPMGGLYSELAFSDDATYTKEQALIVGFSRKPAKADLYLGSASVDYIISVSAPTHDNTPINEGNTYEYLQGVPPDAVDVTIQFPATYSLTSADSIEKDFDLAGVLPSLPEVPFLVRMILSVNHYGEVALHIYDGLRWAIDQINYLTGASMNVEINKQENTVSIHWERGSYSSKAPNGIVKLVDVSTSSELPEWVTMAVRVDWGMHNDITEISIRG